MSKGNSGWRMGADTVGTRFTSNTVDEKQKKLFPELGKDEWLEVRLLSPKEINTIVSETEVEHHEFHTVTTGEGKDEVTVMQRVVWSDWVGTTVAEKLASQNKASEMRFCKTLTGFLLHGEDGQKIPVTEENKKLLMENTQFYKIWFRTTDVLRKQIAEHTEALEKN